MIVLDHHRPAKVSVGNYCAYAAPVGSRPDVLYAFNDNGSLAFAYSRGDGGGRTRDDRAVQRPFSIVLSPGAMVDRLLEGVGVSVVLPPTARPLAQLQPLRHNLPVFSGWSSNAFDAEDGFRHGVYRPRYGASSTESPKVAFFSSDDTETRRHGLFLARVPDFVRRPLAIGPAGQLAVGRLCDQYSSPLKIGRTIPVEFPPLPVSVGDGGHGVWAACADKLAILPDEPGAEVRQYENVFQIDKQEAVTPFAPLYAVSDRLAFRISPQEGKSRNVELVLSRAVLGPDGKSHNLEPLWIPTDLHPANVFSAGICAFVSSTEDVLMMYVPIQGDPGLIRTISIDIE